MLLVLQLLLVERTATKLLLLKKLLRTTSVMMRSPGKFGDEGRCWETWFSYRTQSAGLPRLPLWLAETEELLPATVQCRSLGQTLWITFSSTFSSSTGSLWRLASKPHQLNEVSWVGQYPHIINLHRDHTDLRTKAQAATTWVWGETL